MKFKLLTLASALSLLLGAACVVLWVRRYQGLAVSRISADTGRVAWVWVSGNGRFGQAVAVKDSKTGGWLIGKPAGSVPYVGALIACSTLPLVWLLTWAARRLLCRPRPGTCPVCRYDLRATPDRCPECGTVPAGR